MKKKKAATKLSANGEERSDRNDNPVSGVKYRLNGVKLNWLAGRRIRPAEMAVTMAGVIRQISNQQSGGNRPKLTENQYSAKICKTKTVWRQWLALIGVAITIGGLAGNVIGQPIINGVAAGLAKSFWRKPGRQ